MSLSAEQKNSQMNHERTVLTNLIQAASSGNFIGLQNVVQQYLQQHIDLSIVDVISQFRDGNKRTALHFACQSANTFAAEDIVAQLIEVLRETKQSKKIQKLIRMKDSEGLTPVMIAAQCKHHPLCEQRMQLLFQADITTLPPNERGASFFGKGCSTLGLARSKDGATALHYACGNPYASITTIRETIHTGRVAVRTFSNTGGTPFHWAVTANHLNKAGTTPKHFSITGQSNVYSIDSDGKNSVYVGTLETLLQYGADINAYNQTIPPPLTVAMATGNDVLAHYILSHHGKEKVDLLDFENEVVKQHVLKPSIEYILQPGNVTTLHMAADVNLPNSLSLLLDSIQMMYKSDKDIEAILDRCNDDGYTALDLAAKENHIDCVVLLLNAKNKNTTCTTEDAQLFISKWKPILNAPNFANPASATQSASSDAAVKSDSSNNPTETKARTDASRILAERSTADNTDKVADLIMGQAKKYKERGNAYFSNKQWEDAIGEYSKAIEMQPHVATFYSNRSACYMSVQQYESALYDAVVAQCLDPVWSKAYYRVAIARLALQRYEDAAVAAWEGLQKQPENEELQSLLRKCVKKGRTEYHQK
jgi:ankyrin repeat protein